MPFKRVSSNAYGERISQVPANAQKNDHVFEMAPAEECWPFSGHDTPYQITAIRVLQHNQVTTLFCFLFLIEL